MDGNKHTDRLPGTNALLITAIVSLSVLILCGSVLLILQLKGLKTASVAASDAPATTTTTQTTTTTAAPKTTTAKKATTTTGAATTTTAATTSATTTATTPKTTRLATDEEVDAILREVYNKYYPEMMKTLGVLEDELQERRKQADTLAVSYQTQLQRLELQYANMGMLNSGAYQSAVDSAYIRYHSQSAAIGQRIREIEEEMAAIKAAYDDLIISEAATKVIELQKSTAE